MKNEFENENIVETRFDQASKILAEGLTRRQSLRRIGGGLAGVIVGSLVSRVGAAIDRNDVCAHWCDANFPPGPARGDCKSQAAHFMGPCYQCGPAAPPVHGEFCGGVCCNLNEVCTNNVCAPAAGHNAVDCFCSDGMHYGPFCTNINCDFSNIQQRVDFCNSVCASNGSGSQVGTGCLTDEFVTCP